MRSGGEKGTGLDTYGGEGINHCKTAIGWQPEGNRKRGRSKITRMRTTKMERNAARWPSWNIANAAAKDKKAWNDSVVVLCDFWKGKY